MLFVPYPVCVGLAQACETQQAGLLMARLAKRNEPVAQVPDVLTILLLPLKKQFCCSLLYMLVYLYYVPCVLLVPKGMIWTTRDRHKRRRPDPFPAGPGGAGL